jgi:PQQ-dependent dehydrogenase (methanol/ethanol family)
MKITSQRLGLGLGVTAFVVFLGISVRQANTQNAPGADVRLAAGKQSFVNHCAACHGEDGHGGALGPSLLEGTRATSRQAVHELIVKGIPTAGMPAFSKLPDMEVDSIAAYVMSLKVPAGAANIAPPVATAGDVQAGFEFFTHEGKCLSCHAVRGRGGVVGPDLAGVGRTRTAALIEQQLTDPGSLPPAAGGGRRGGGGEGGFAAAAAYAAATVKLRDGKTIRGALKNETAFDLQLQGLDGKLYLLSKDQVADVAHEKGSLMPKAQATPEQMKNLLAYLTRLTGEMDKAVPLPPSDMQPGVTFEQVVHPKEGEWPTYNGNVSGNRFSLLQQINTKNVTQLAPKWMFTLPGTRRALENTPVVADGIMYVTGSNECFALDARTGRQIWHYERPRTKDLVPTGDAASGINRGVAILGDRVFMVTDNARLIALQRYTGQLLWDIEMADYKQNYGATQAPLVVGDFVISGISGGDEGVRGFLSAYKASTGERVWRFWTTPLAGEPGSETWVGTSLQHPGASTWMTGTYDPEAKILYWGVGNPGPDHNGDQRKGDNLYSCSILALDPLTGKLIWYRQLTPHNLHDWDSTQTPMLVNATFHGKPRKLLMQANRNGFFYVLDRLTGEFLLGAPFINNMSWASGVDKDGRPILKGDSTPTYEGTRVCPTPAGATNWPSGSFDPQTGHFLIFANESCAVYVKRDEEFELGKSFYGGTTRRSVGDTSEKFLRAIDVQTGKIAWEIPKIGGSGIASGLMSTAGGLVIYGDGFGAIVAADAKNGSLLWHFNTGQSFKGSPMVYSIDGKERIVMIAGQTVISFGL